ncbi:MAG: V-type ATP synthase subunit D [Bacteroidota bacterium]
MALKFHYNKTTIQQFRRQLAIREKALPILKNKETALRKEEKEMAKLLSELKKDKEQVSGKLQEYASFWTEFPTIVSLHDPKIITRKIIGVKVPEIAEVSFKLEDVSWWQYPAWLPAGIDILQQFIELDISIDIKTRQLYLLNRARKKTTQKVNLYEKVQIPAYEDAIMKIKRFLEDKDNISKAAQKIVKKRKEGRLAA